MKSRICTIVLLLMSLFVNGQEDSYLLIKLFSRENHPIQSEIRLYTDSVNSKLIQSKSFVDRTVIKASPGKYVLKVFLCDTLHFSEMITVYDDKSLMIISVFEKLIPLSEFNFSELESDDRLITGFIEGRFVYAEF
jgi:hypothetical protein